MRKLIDYIAVSRLAWILAFLFTVGLMSYVGVWTDHQPVPTEITE